MTGLTRRIAIRQIVPLLRSAKSTIPRSILPASRHGRSLPVGAPRLDKHGLHNLPLGIGQIHTVDSRITTRTTLLLPIIPPGINNFPLRTIYEMGSSFLALPGRAANDIPASPLLASWVKVDWRTEQFNASDRASKYAFFASALWLEVQSGHEVAG